MSDREEQNETTAKAGRQPYESPRIVHEEAIESVAVACDPASNCGLPVKSADGAPNTCGGFCQNGFLNS